MNKDVIYIEPEDDITDIILKIENSKEKIVALVPPKKAGVFRSIVNIKLIAKAGVSSEKTVVLVTVDPSIIKLAATAKLPVTKDLQSAPSIPAVVADDDNNDTEEDELVEEEDGTVETKEDVRELKPSKAERESAKAKQEEDADEEEGDDGEEDEPAKKPKKSKESVKLSGNKLLDWLKVHKKLSIFGGVCLVGLIGFLVWAFGFAPAVDVTVAIRTDQKNFSENITFTDNLASEDAKEGKFYLEQKKLDMVQEINFEATGQKNNGAKASGEVIISAVFDAPGTVAINNGTIFTNNGLSYASNEYKALGWNGDEDECENEKKISGGKIQCLISEKVSVTAVEGGSKYNIGASSTGWSTVANINVYSKSAMAGGTDDVITVVQQADVERAKSEVTNAKEDEIKTKLYETIDDKYYVIDSSFEVSSEVAAATPGVDEKVDSGVQPTLKATTTATVYVIDKVKLEEFIHNKADLAEDQKIYDVKDIYIENISQIKTGATTKLKAQYFIGPKITESEVVDKIKGRGLGDAQREIRDIYGVSDVTMRTSYPWVMSVPGDSNKIQVKFEVKDQNGNEIKSDDTSEDEESTDKDSSSTSNEEEKKEQ